MADNIQRSKGRGSAYKFDRGGTPTEFGPFIGVVKNNIDPTRSGRLQVYIEQFAGDDPEDASLWRTVMYVPPFYGVTPRNNSSSTSGPGSYKGNQQSYGMWWTPPDLGVQVICFFVAGDPNQGYYIGCVPDPGVTHMIPAIGSSKKFETQSTEQKNLTDSAKSEQLPVVEINAENPTLYENPRFFAEPKPVHSYVFSILANQGLLSDYIRGPISSSAQRESPSSVFGMITPGRPIYQGGLSEADIKSKIDAGEIKLEDVKVEGRRGGHSIVLDDGDLRGRDNLIRIRTAKGHQITMSDEADCFYFIAANGQTWIEMGSEGTVDVYSTNSVNIRSQGVINLRADKDINIDAVENLNIRAGNIQIESKNTTKVSSEKDFTLYSKTKIGALSDGVIALNSNTGGWKTTGGMTFKGSRIDLNGGAAPDKVEAPKPLAEFKLDDTKFVEGKGWQPEKDAIVTIVTRAPTHEPYQYHNRGVPVETDLSASSPSAPTAGADKALSGTTDAVVTKPINTADVLKTPVAGNKVGSLSPGQVTGLVSQAKAQVNQAASAVSVDKGIGQFGFKPVQLEASGYLKPGTINQLQAVTPPTPTEADIAEAARINSEGGDVTAEQVSQNRKINQMLTSPTLWTGQSGVTNLGALLSNEKLQVSTQQNLMNTALSGLKTSGLATGQETPQQLSGLLQAATVAGVGAVASLAKGIGSADIKSAVTNIAKNAQFATNFIDTKMGAFGGLGRIAAPAQDTVNRAVVDTAVTNSLNDPKIPAPQFKPVEREPDVPTEESKLNDEIKKILEETLAFLDSVKVLADKAIEESIKLDGQQPLTASQIAAFSALRDTYRDKFNGSWKSIYIPKLQELESSKYDPVRSYANSVIASINRLVRLLQGISESQKALIEQWRSNAGITTT